MRALVTGGSGFIGANLTRRLIADGHEVHLLLRPRSDRWRIEGLEGFREHRGGVEDRDAVLSAVEAARPDWIFHLAAHGAYSFQTDVAAMVRANVEGTANLVEGAVRTGCAAFVNTGSSSEYGDCGFAPAETQPPNPNSDYAVTKTAATWLCRQAAIKAGLPSTTLRLYSAYGPWEDPRRLMPTLVAHALRGTWPPLNSPDTARDFVYVDDVVAAYLLAVATKPSEPGVVYNVGSGVETKLGDLASLAAEVFGISGKPEWGGYPARAWDTAVWYANTNRIQQSLGWHPREELKRGIRQFADIISTKGYPAAGVDSPR